MDIGRACKTVRLWDDLFVTGRTAAVQPENLGLAVAEVKRYLETARADGKPIRELEIPDHILLTPEGVHFVMPFVVSAESFESGRGR